MTAAKKNRSKVSCYKTIFDKIKIFYKGGVSVYPIHERHYVDTTQDDDALIEESTVLDIFEVDKSLKGVVFNFSGKMYLSFICPHDINSYSGLHFNCLEVNAGFWTFVASVLKLDVDRTKTTIEVYDKLLAVPDGVASGFCQPVSFSVLEGFFPKLFLYEINATFRHHSLVSKCMGYVLCNSDEIKESKGNDLVSNYSNVFESFSGHIPYDLIIHSLYGTQKKYSFIELYRCIEFIFPVPATRNLISKLFSGGGLNPIGFAKTIEEEISWRPKEEDALGRIISDLPITLVDEGRVLVGSITCGQNINTEKYIYKLRNSTVHFRRSLTNEYTKIDSQTWDRINIYILKVILSSYESYDLELNKEFLAITE